MTRDEAITIRNLQLRGREIAPTLLAEAIEVIKRTVHQLVPKTADRVDGAQKKGDMTKANLRKAIKADQETRQDRGNRILLAKLQLAMPHWKQE